MVIVVKNLYNGEEKEYDINRMHDFDKLVIDFGPHISQILGDFSNVRAAADRVAEYLSNHHLHVTITDPEDKEKIYDPNVEKSGNAEEDRKKGVSLKDILETYDEAEYVDIPEYHVINAATHRWGNH